MVSKAVSDPPREGGVKAAPETGKQRSTHSSIVEKRAIERACPRRSAPIRKNPDSIESNKEIDSDHTTLRAPKVSISKPNEV